MHLTSFINPTAAQLSRRTNRENLYYIGDHCNVIYYVSRKCRICHHFAIHAYSLTKTRTSVAIFMSLNITISFQIWVTLSLYSMFLTLRQCHVVGSSNSPILFSSIMHSFTSLALPVLEEKIIEKKIIKQNCKNLRRNPFVDNDCKTGNAFKLTNYRDR